MATASLLPPNTTSLLPGLLAWVLGYGSSGAGEVPAGLPFIGNLYATGQQSQQGRRPHPHYHQYPDPYYQAGSGYQQHPYQQQQQQAGGAGPGAGAGTWGEPGQQGGQGAYQQQHAEAPRRPHQQQPQQDSSNQQQQQQYNDHLNYQQQQYSQGHQAGGVGGDQHQAGYEGSHAQGAGGGGTHGWAGQGQVPGQGRGRTRGPGGGPSPYPEPFQQHPSGQALKPHAPAHHPVLPDGQAVAVFVVLRLPRGHADLFQLTGEECDGFKWQVRSSSSPPLSNLHAVRPQRPSRSPPCCIPPICVTACYLAAAAADTWP